MDILKAIDARDRDSEVSWKPGGADHPPAHCLSFAAQGDTEFGVQLDASSPMPIPARGDIITVHDRHVRVVAVRTAYTRDETTGGVKLYTDVVIAADVTDQTPLADQYT